MDFFKFVETYKEDIAAFFEALVAWVKAIVAKLSEGDESAEA
jgi:hypothetical protein